jgi:hypothetical protein
MYTEVVQIEYRIIASKNKVQFECVAGKDAAMFRYFKKPTNRKK